MSEQPTRAEPAVQPPPKGPPARLGRRVALISIRELPRVVRDVRWALVVVVALFVAGAVTARYSYLPILHYEVFRRLHGERTTAGQHLVYTLAKGTYWAPWYPSFLDLSGRTHAWYGTWEHNVLVGAYTALVSAVSVGLWAMRSAWCEGWRFIWEGIGIAKETEHTTGLSVLAVSLLLVLPHGLLEIPASWLVQAGALRVGLAWVRPKRGLGRKASLLQALRDLSVIFAVTVPVLAVTALLETYGTQPIEGRYLIGIGAAPGMISERRVMPPSRYWSDYFDEIALSPDRTRVAYVSEGDSGLWSWSRVDGERKQWAVLGRAVAGSPTFSPDGQRLAYVVSHFGRNGTLQGSLCIASLRVLKQFPVPGGPPGRYLSAAWSPRTNLIAVAVQPQARDYTRNKPANLWLADLKTKRWRQITHFNAPTGLVTGSGLAWSPSGKKLVFARTGSDRRSSGLWIMAKDGSGLHRITRGSFDVNPAWSPHGDRVAFIRSPFGGTRYGALLSDPFAKGELCLVRADGTGRKNGLAKVDPFCYPTWYRDGKHLLYLRTMTALEGVPR